MTWSSLICHVSTLIPLPFPLPCVSTYPYVCRFCVLPTPPPLPTLRMYVFLCEHLSIFPLRICLCFAFTLTAHVDKSTNPLRFYQLQNTRFRLYIQCTLLFQPFVSEFFNVFHSRLRVADLFTSAWGDKVLEGERKKGRSENFWAMSSLRIRGRKVRTSLLVLLRSQSSRPTCHTAPSPFMRYSQTSSSFDLWGTLFMQRKQSVLTEILVWRRAKKVQSIRFTAQSTVPASPE